jgi:hypothetical protein
VHFARTKASLTIEDREQTIHTSAPFGPLNPLNAESLAPSGVREDQLPSLPLSRQDQGQSCDKFSSIPPPPPNPGDGLYVMRSYSSGCSTDETFQDREATATTPPPPSKMTAGMITSRHPVPLNSLDLTRH